MSSSKEDCNSCITAACHHNSLVCQESIFVLAACFFRLQHRNDLCFLKSHTHWWHQHTGNNVHDRTWSVTAEPLWVVRNIIFRIPKLVGGFRFVKDEGTSFGFEQHSFLGSKAQLHSGHPLAAAVPGTEIGTLVSRFVRRGFCCLFESLIKLLIDGWSMMKYQ